MSTVKANTVTAATTNGNVSIVGNGTGKVTLGDGNLIFPDADGTAGQFLQTSGSGTLSFAGGGKIGQVIQAVKTDTFSVTGTTYATVTGLTVDITPSSTSSKMLIIGHLALGTSDFMAYAQLLRDSTVLFIGDAASNRPRVTLALPYASTSPTYMIAAQPICYLDSPSTTSQVTYGVQIASYDAAKIAYVNRTHADRDTTAYEPRTASSFTVMEVLA